MRLLSELYGVAGSDLHAGGLRSSGRPPQVEADIKVLNDEFRVPYLPELWQAKTRNREKDGIPERDREVYLVDANRLEQRMQEAVVQSPLPEVVQNYSALNDFLLRLRLGG